MSTAMWVTGASSGIGAAVADLALDRVDALVGFSRRRASAGRWVQADLSDPGAWPAVVEEITRGLAETGAEHAVLFHCAGASEPTGHLAEVDATAYARAVQLNFVAGPVLGHGFVAACRTAGVRATLVLCGSPAADKVPPGLSHYSAGKAALHQWARCAAAELEGTDARVVTVVPYAVETALVHGILAHDADRVPLVEYFRDVQRRGAFATPAEAAEQIWAAIEGAANGGFVPVGAVPAGVVA